MSGVTKVCTGCWVAQPLDNFWRDSRRSDGHNYRCKACKYPPSKAAIAQARTKRWTAENKAQKTTYDRNYNLKVKYGITQADYERMLEEQGGVCAICSEASDVVLHVDHCHQTGQVRGLLCTGCNTGLGLMRDDVSIIESAIRYLEAA